MTNSKPNENQQCTYRTKSNDENESSAVQSKDSKCGNEESQNLSAVGPSILPVGIAVIEEL